MILWRISNYADLTGTGGLWVDGRWHHKGVPILYCAEHPGTTLLEVLVHVDIATVPDKFQLLEIHCPDDISLIRPPIDPVQLHDKNWTQAYGDDFLSANLFCLLKVPSAVLPAAHNILVNPRHPEAGRLSIISTTKYPFDSRLFGR